MRKYIVFASVSILVLAVCAIAISQNVGGIREILIGYEEVPAVSTTANGQFSARIAKDESSIEYELSYSSPESPVQQAHIHLGQRSVNGGISVWLCGNNPPITNTPAGVQPCPPVAGTITGTIEPADVVGPSGQGIAAGEFAELIRAMRAGVTYVNVHKIGRASCRE